ncbi:MAG: GspE/PulE family protein [Chthoniobacteraceae bacterium]
MKFVNQIIREAIVERATDIHVEPLENDLRIRYRIDGILHEVAVPPQLRVLQSAIISRLKVMAHMDIAERRLPQDGRINLKRHGQGIDVRVSTIPTVNGESISLRLLSRTETLTFGLERLDMSEKQAEWRKGCSRSPTASSSSPAPPVPANRPRSTRSSPRINAVTRRIITIEEPVEYRLPGVSQIDVKPEIGLTFANWLRAILRQDPNIVMVGEIRDFETAEIAIRAAMTGHLVFSTLHTNDAVSGITRLLDMGIEPFLLASVVRAFIAQRLVRTICPDCKQETGYPVEYLQRNRRPHRARREVLQRRWLRTSAATLATAVEWPFTRCASSMNRCAASLLEKRPAPSSSNAPSTTAWAPCASTAGAASTRVAPPWRKSSASRKATTRWPSPSEGKGPLKN